MGQAFKSSAQRQRYLKIAWRRQGGDCALCGKPVALKDATIDHITPISRGGAKRDPANLQATHSKCNHRKGNRRKMPKPFRWPNHPITAGEFYALITRSKFRTAAKRISLNRGDDIWTCYRCGEPIPYGRRNVRVVNAREAKGNFLPFSRLALAHWICDDLNVRANGSEWIRRPPRPSESADQART